MLQTLVTLQLLGQRLSERVRRDDGATAVEYGLLVALIAAVIVVIVATLGGQIAAAFQTIVDALS